jgi:O-antigen ligase
MDHQDITDGLHHRESRNRPAGRASTDSALPRSIWKRRFFEHELSSQLGRTLAFLTEERATNLRWGAFMHGIHRLGWHVVANAAMHATMYNGFDQRVAAAGAGSIAPISGPRFLVASLLLSAAYLLGGSAGDLPDRGMLIELVSVLTIVLVTNAWSGPRPSNFVMITVLVIFGLPLAQLVPLPYWIWTAFPGREIAIEVTRLIDPAMWRPLTLDPNATLNTWFTLLVPLAMFFAVLQMQSRERLALIILLIGLAAASAILGLLQTVSRSDLLYPFVSEHKGLPIGLFANRNHQAALMYVALSFTAALTQIRFIAECFPAARVSAIGVGSLLIATVFATGSRAGMVLTVVSLLLSLLVIFRAQYSRRTAVGASVVVFAGAALLLSSGVVRASIARLLFQSSDGRYEFWPEAVYSAAAYLPFGAGLGSFVTSYQATEQLATVGYHYVNHAHNDYLEVALEAGVPGIVSMGLLLILCVMCVWRVLARDPRDEVNCLARAATIVILCLLLHAMVDYPLRTFGHLALFGMSFGLLFRPPEVASLINGKYANTEERSWPR